MLTRALFAVGLVVALLPVALLAGPNLLTNPSFESALTGWTGYGNVYVENLYAQDGTRSLKMYGTWSSPWNASGAFQNLTASPGQLWIFSGFGLNPATDGVPAGNLNIALLKIIWFDGANATGNQLQPLPGQGAVFGQFPGIESNQINAASPPDEWQAVLASGEAPPNTQSAQLMAIFLQPNYEGGSLWFDNLLATLGGCDAHNPVFDLDDDGVVGLAERDAFLACWTGPAIPMAADASEQCKCMDRSKDLAIDQQDYGIFMRCYTGAAGGVNPACDD
jgi:hypothetical protein